MGPTLVLVFLAVFALLIVKAVVQRKLNPYNEVAWPALPDDLRSEIERLLPGFQPGAARLTRKGDEARVAGEYLGESMRIEADFGRDGSLVELEIEGPRGGRSKGLASREDLPAATAREIDRVLGASLPRFQPSLVTRGTTGGEPHFEVKGSDGEWKWEIAVSESGRLLEVEKEKRR